MISSRWWPLALVLLGGCAGDDKESGDTGWTGTMPPDVQDGDPCEWTPTPACLDYDPCLWNPDCDSADDTGAPTGGSGYPAATGDTGEPATGDTGEGG